MSAAPRATATQGSANPAPPAQQDVRSPLYYTPGFRTMACVLPSPANLRAKPRDAVTVKYFKGTAGTFHPTVRTVNVVKDNTTGHEKPFLFPPLEPDAKRWVAHASNAPSAGIRVAKSYGYFQHVANADGTIRIVRMADEDKMLKTHKIFIRPRDDPVDRESRLTGIQKRAIFLRWIEIARIIYNACLAWTREVPARFGNPRKANGVWSYTTDPVTIHNKRSVNALQMEFFGLWAADNAACLSVDQCVMIRQLPNAIRWAVCREFAMNLCAAARRCIHLGHRGTLQYRRKDAQQLSIPIPKACWNTGQYAQLGLRPDLQPKVSNKKQKNQRVLPDEASNQIRMVVSQRQHGCNKRIALCFPVPIEMVKEEDRPDVFSFVAEDAGKKRDTIVAVGRRGITAANGPHGNKPMRVPVSFGAKKPDKQKDAVVQNTRNFVHLVGLQDANVAVGGYQRMMKRHGTLENALRALGGDDLAREALASSASTSDDADADAQEEPFDSGEVNVDPRDWENLHRSQTNVFVDRLTDPAYVAYTNSLTMEGLAGRVATSVSAGATGENVADRVVSLDNVNIGGYTGQQSQLTTSTTTLSSSASSSLSSAASRNKSKRRRTGTELAPKSHSTDSSSSNNNIAVTTRHDIPPEVPTGTTSAPGGAIRRQNSPGVGRKRRATVASGTGDSEQSTVGTKVARNAQKASTERILGYYNYADNETDTSSSTRDNDDTDYTSGSGSPGTEDTDTYYNVTKSGALVNDKGGRGSKRSMQSGRKSGGKRGRNSEKSGRRGRGKGKRGQGRGKRRNKGGDVHGDTLPIDSPEAKAVDSTSARPPKPVDTRPSGQGMAGRLEYVLNKKGQTAQPYVNPKPFNPRDMTSAQAEMKVLQVSNEAVISEQLVKIDALFAIQRNPNIHSRARRVARDKRLRLFRKIRDLVATYQWRLIKWCFKHGHRVILSWYRLSQMVRRKGRNGRARVISKRTARIMLHQAHYLQTTRFMHKAREWGANLTLIHEYHTTKTCSNGHCLMLKCELRGEDVYKCDHCGRICGRDDNGAVNNLVTGFVQAYGSLDSSYGITEENEQFISDRDLGDDEGDDIEDGTNQHDVYQENPYADPLDDES